MIRILKNKANKNTILSTTKKYFQVTTKLKSWAISKQDAKYVSMTATSDSLVAFLGAILFSTLVSKTLVTNFFLFCLTEHTFIECQLCTKHRPKDLGLQLEKHVPYILEPILQKEKLTIRCTSKNIVCQSLLKTMRKKKHKEGLDSSQEREGTVELNVSYRDLYNS